MNVGLAVLGVIVLTVLAAVVSPWIGGAVFLAGVVLVAVMALAAARGIAADPSTDGGSRTPPEPVSLPGPGDPDSGVDRTGARD